MTLLAAATTRGEAEKLQALVTEIRNKVLGPQHLDTLSGMNSLSLTY